MKDNINNLGLVSLSGQECLCVNGGESSFPLDEAPSMIGHTIRRWFNNTRDFFIGIVDGWNRPNDWELYYV